VAFWATAIITYIAIVWGYFHNCFRIKQNRADMFIKTFCLRPWYFIRRKKLDPALVLKQASERNLDNFQDLMRAFSDQQLVTGLAMLVALFMKGNVPVYSYAMAVSMAWFSTTSHLATLFVLRG